MTVRELMEKLAAQPPDMEVGVVEDTDGAGIDYRPPAGWLVEINPKGEPERTVLVLLPRDGHAHALLQRATLPRAPGEVE